MPTTMGRRRFIAAAALGPAAALGSGRATAVEPVKRAGPARMKLSCCAYSYRQFLSGDKRTMTLDDFIGTCADIGLDGVELTSYYFPSTDAAYLNHLKRQCFLNGLDVSGTAAGNNFCVAPGEGRDRQIAGVRQWIDHAADLGAPVMRVFAGSAPRGTSEEDARQWVVECLQECAEHAAERGVILALENHGGATTTANGLVAILTKVESEWVGANLDTGNFRSADPYADADFGRIVGILRGANYRGYLSIEYEAREDPRTGVPKFAERLRAALA
jgi:sugar phosphate isomerase/epimerase